MDMFIATTFHYLLTTIVKESRLIADENEIAPFLDAEPEALYAAIQEHPDQLYFPAVVIDGIAKIPIIPFIQTMTGSSLPNIESTIEMMYRTSGEEQGIITTE